jgi:DNA-binding HxlR family transcriptional regulator
MDRRAYQQRPERHDYVLTEKGRDLRRILISLLQWGDRWSTLP